MSAALKLRNLADDLLTASNFADGRTAAQRALAAAREENNRTLEVEMLLELARCDLSEGNLDAALEQMRSLVESLDDEVEFDMQAHVRMICEEVALETRLYARFNNFRRRCAALCQADDWHGVSAELEAALEAIPSSGYRAHWWEACVRFVEGESRFAQGLMQWSLRSLRYAEQLALEFPPRAQWLSLLIAEAIKRWQKEDRERWGE